MFYSIRSFLDEPEYCSKIGLVPGIKNKTFVVQVCHSLFFSIKMFDLLHLTVPIVVCFCVLARVLVMLGCTAHTTYIIMGPSVLG